MAKKQFRSSTYFKSRINRKSLTPHQIVCYRAWQEFDVHYDVRTEVPDAIADRLEYTRPEPPEHRQIHGWNLPIEKQKFPYYSKEVKKNWEDAMDSAHPRHQKYLDFIAEEWRRRVEGFWFYNGGRLEYITGHHYMFLQYWMIPVAKEGRNVMSNPDFRDVHRTLFYALDIAKKDDRCYGLLYYSMRRAGKTAVATSHGFFDTTAYRDQRMTIQSKNEKDGKGVYNKLKESWKELPAFFKPADNGDSDPQTQISFFEKKNKGEITKREYSKAYINSYIRWDGAKESALDGMFFSYIINDEVGKCPVGLDPNERWNINKECLAVGTDIIGFAYVTSTIEDFEKFSARESQILWERSDPINALDITTDRTDSGLYRLFLPAYYGLQGGDKDGNKFVDEYGYTDIKRAYRYIRSQYEFKKGNDLLSYRRKYPITIDDSFALADSGNNFSKEKIFQQTEHNKNMTQNPMRKGNFVWKGGVRNSEVVFHPDTNGRWEVSWIPPENDRNKFTEKGGQRHPARDYSRMGVDTFDHTYVVEGGSKAAAVTIVNHPMVGNGAVVCVYLHRQEYAENFFEDMIMQAVFYSSPALIENNKPGLIEHFRKRGYNGFALKDPLETDQRKLDSPRRGISTTGDAKIQQMIDNTQAFIYDHIGLNEAEGTYGWCPHEELLRDLLTFQPNKRTKYDLTMAMLMATTAFRNRQKKIEMRRFENIGDWFPTYNK